LELDEFVPPVDPDAVDNKGRPMYAVPWAIKDPCAARDLVNEYVDQNIGRYMDLFLDDTDSLDWTIFHAAYRTSMFPVPVSTHLRGMCPASLDGFHHY
jgi:hypothetical protein